MLKGQGAQMELWNTFSQQSCDISFEVCVCVDLISQYKIKGKGGTVMNFICLTMIHPSSGWFEVIELPYASIECNQKGEEISEVVKDK